MLQHTFCHIPRVGVKTEAKLWEAGIHTWEHLFAASAPPLRGNTLDLCRRHLEFSQERLEAEDAGFFANAMPASEAWRLFPHFRHNAAYVDIETTGLAPPHGQITSIALYDGRETRCYVQGRNLDDFGHDIRDYALLVTFNGRCFDAPFIERCLGVELPVAHMDLRFALKAAGVTGGLKRVEQSFGLHRGELDGVDGYFAVLLWQEFERSRDERALETLLAYNIEDVLNLEYLAVRACNLMLERLPFGREQMLDEPLPGLNPMLPDTALINRLRQRYGI
jgi:uncharacterized protein